MSRTLLFFFTGFIAFSSNRNASIKAMPTKTFRDWNFFIKDTTMRIATLDKAIEELKQSGVEYLFTYYIFSAGDSGRSIFVGPGPYPCESIISRLA